MSTIKSLALLSAFVAMTGTAVPAAASTSARTNERAPAKSSQSVTRQQVLDRAALKFDRADRDNNGRLTGDELNEYRQHRKERLARKRARDEKLRARNG